MQTSIVKSELEVAGTNDVDLRKVARTRSVDFYKEHNVAAVASNLESNNGNDSSICGRINELRGSEFEEKFVICVQLCFFKKLLKSQSVIKDYTE